MGPTTACRCGCGESVSGKRVFVNKEHQLTWMAAGGAREIGALEPPEARARGGHVAGTILRDTGQLADAGRKGGQKAKEIAERWRETRSRD